MPPGQGNLFDYNIFDYKNTIKNERTMRKDEKPAENNLREGADAGAEVKVYQPCGWETFSSIATEQDARHRSHAVVRVVPINPRNRWISLERQHPNYENVNVSHKQESASNSFWHKASSAMLRGWRRLRSPGGTTRGHHVLLLHHGYKQHPPHPEKPPPRWDFRRNTAGDRERGVSAKGDNERPSQHRK